MSKQYFVDSKANSGGSLGNESGKVMAKTAFINDRAYEIQDGDTILTLMRRHHGKDAIPTLCDAPNLDPFGSCRVCSVDVALVKDGPVKTMASCHTPVMPNSYIYTESERVQALETMKKLDPFNPNLK
jgi:formate dehydrogenase major subunit